VRAKLQDDGLILDTEQKKLQRLLKKLRKEAGLSQQALADSLGKPQSFVSKYESGERRLDILELRLICHHLGISLVTFVQYLEGVLDDASNLQAK